MVGGIGNDVRELAVVSGVFGHIEIFLQKCTLILGHEVAVWLCKWRLERGKKRKLGLGGKNLSNGSN